MSTRITLGRAVDIATLDKDIAALGLPSYKGIAKLTRDVDVNGKAILDQNGKPVKVLPYLLIQADPLTAPQIASVQTVIGAHVIPPRAPTQNEE